MSVIAPDLEPASAQEVLAYGVQRFGPRLTMACSAVRPRPYGHENGQERDYPGSATCRHRRGCGPLRFVLEAGLLNGDVIGARVRPLAIGGQSPTEAST